MNKLIEKLLYSFGLNFCLYDLSSELNLLKDMFPRSFKERDVMDIGCGDGKISLKLKEITKPKTFKGVDLSQSMVASARKKGIDARVLDVENQDLSGDLGILWGALHHFENPVETLKKIYRNFKSLTIRECINDKRFDLGHKLNRESLIKILSDAGIKVDQCKIIESKKTKSLIIFVNSN